jgi:glycosyltransferase involved in cell wall biosynthesis
MKAPAFVQSLKERLLECAAPEGSALRLALRRAKAALEARLPRRLRFAPLFQPPPAMRPLNIFDREAMRTFTRGTRANLIDWSPQDAETGELGAARFVLGLLRDRPDLRRQFPLAIRDGASGTFCRWLCTEGVEELALSRPAVENIRSAFRRRPGDRVRQAYDHLRPIREAYPLAFTPAGRRSFLWWLLTAGKADCGLLDEEIWWFLHECAEDPAHGLVATYLRTPEWQARFPHGLTVFGQEALRNWVRQRYQIDGEWLTDAVFPQFLAPADELRLLHAGEPELAALAPHAFRDPEDGKRLVAWVREHGAKRAALDERWLAQLDREVAAGRLQQPGVNLLGHFCHPSGIQEAVHATVRALHSAHVRTSCRDIPARLMRDLPNRSAYMGLEVFDYTLLHVAPEPMVEVFYPHSGLAPRPGVYRIVVWFWELEEVPAEWVKYAQVIDEIWAPTQFIARAMRKTMPMPVVDMLPAVDLGPVPSLPRSHFGLPDDRFIFLFCFDMSSVMERKNPLGLIQAFQRAFAGDSRVQLVIKLTRGDTDPAGLRRLTEAASAAGVTLIDRVMPREESRALMNCCDCYVSLHRSEGFGYTLAEAMLLGKPVIATGYSGNRDFMSSANSLLVEYQRVPITQDLPFYPRGAVWAEPSTEHAAHLLRWVFEHPRQAQALGAKAREDVRRLLSPDAVGRRMVRRLRELEAARLQKSPLAA